MGDDGVPLAVDYVDGRQSARALEIARGTIRHLRSLGFECLTEVTLKTGRRADIMALSDKGDVWILEVKSSVADFQADSKWPEYEDFCDRLLFAVAPDFPREMLSDDVGVVVADRYGAEVVRDAPEGRLSAARRKTILVRFARTAASRITVVNDPMGMNNRS